MIYPDVSLEEWLKKCPGLRVLTQPCPSCGSEIVTDRPFISKDYAGLEGKFCKTCGHQRNSSSLQPISSKSIDAWSENFS